MVLFGLRQKQFDQTVRACSADLYRFAYWLCRDRFVAEDLVQETFTRAWNSWENLKDAAAVKSWLITILRNEHARLYERKKLEYADMPVEDIDIAQDNEPSSQMELEQLVEALPLTLREPLVMQVLGGFSCEDIARMLDTTEGAIMTRLTRARQALRQHLAAAESRGVLT